MELFKPDFGLIFWMFVSVVILLFILYKWGWPAIMKGVESRADFIDKGVEYAQSAKEQLDNARAESEKYVAEARRRQAEMLREADRMKTQIIEEARAAAGKEAAKVMEAAKVSIERERKEAEDQLRRDVAAMSLSIAEKVVRGQMADTKAQTALVDSLITDMEKQN